MTDRIVFESERILHSILEGFSIPAFVIDKNHKILYWNRALEKLTGVKAADVKGTNQQWRVFYKKERPCMADLLVDSAVEKVPKWYSGKYQKSEPHRRRIRGNGFSFQTWVIAAAGSGLQPPSSAIFRESSLGLLKRWKTSPNKNWHRTL